MVDFRNDDPMTRWSISGSGVMPDGTSRFTDAEGKEIKQLGLELPITSPLRRGLIGDQWTDKKSQCKQLVWIGRGLRTMSRRFKASSLEAGQKRSCGLANCNAKKCWANSSWTKPSHMFAAWIRLFMMTMTMTMTMRMTTMMMMMMIIVIIVIIIIVTIVIIIVIIVIIFSTFMIRHVLLALFLLFLLSLRIPTPSYDIKHPGCMVPTMFSSPPLFTIVYGLSLPISLTKTLSTKNRDFQFRNLLVITQGGHHQLSMNISWTFHQTTPT